MRIISGSQKGRKLVPISGNRIRPTSDRVKEAIFNILGPSIYNTRILDLFCGTGSLGIEALSRGAKEAFFLDIDTSTVLKNIELCKMSENTQVFQNDLLTDNSLSILSQKNFDFIFIDPPYGKLIIEQTCGQSQFMKLLTNDSIIIAEHSIREKLELDQAELDIYRQKKYSKTMISFIRKK